MTWEVRIKLPENEARELFGEMFDRGHRDIELVDDRGEPMKGWKGDKPDSIVFKHGRNL